jgi:hypothetical protein
MEIKIRDLKAIAFISYKMGLKEKLRFELDMFLENKILELKKVKK